MKNADKLKSKKWRCVQSYGPSVKVGTVIHAMILPNDKLRVLEHVPTHYCASRNVFTKGNEIPITGMVWHWEPVIKPTSFQRIKNWLNDEPDYTARSYD